MAYSIFKKLADHETVWVGHANAREEAKQKLKSLAGTFSKDFYALDFETGETILSKDLILPSNPHDTVSGAGTRSGNAKSTPTKAGPA
jgi:hypothetical protein